MIPTNKEIELHSLNHQLISWILEIDTKLFMANRDCGLKKVAFWSWLEQVRLP